MPLHLHGQVKRWGLARTRARPEKDKVPNVEPLGFMSGSKKTNTNVLLVVDPSESSVIIAPTSTSSQNDSST